MDSKSEQIKDGGIEIVYDEVEVEDDQAAKALAEAFDTILEYRAYIPARMYRDLDDALSEWLNDAHWMENPELRRQILPILLKAVLMDPEGD